MADGSAEERWQLAVATLRRVIDDAVPLSADLRRGVAAQSRAYRGGEQPPLATRAAVDAYVASRMPATLAATGGAMRAAALAVPSFAPATMLDVGTGTGSAAWAASAVWPSLETITGLDRSEAMLAVGRELADRSEVPVLGAARWVAGSVTAAALEPADLLSAAYVLGEVREELRAPLVARLWELARGVLLLVEPGTPAGFGRIRAARAQLIALGGHVAAPCPHDGACPMVDPDWCHFAARLSRSRLHRLAKGVELAWEDEPYAYAAVSRLAVERGSRVLARPDMRKGAIGLRLCTPEGIVEQTVSRRDGARYREARRLAWGARAERNDE